MGREGTPLSSGSVGAMTLPHQSGSVLDEFWRDELGGEWVRTVAGRPGTWKQIRPTVVRVDPASGTIPTGYLILNITDGAVKRHTGAYSWEITVRANTSAKVGFHGATPTAQRANANQATAADLAVVITLANELRAALAEKGIIKGRGVDGDTAPRSLLTWGQPSPALTTPGI
jgi:hypothetical protein